MPDRPDDFAQWLDVLLSRYLPEEGHVALAEELHAVANGLVTLLGPRPAWNAEAQRVDVPFRRAEELEASLEDFLTRNAICVPVDGVPMLKEMTMRVIAADQHVDIPVRSVQKTAAGVVFQVKVSDVASGRRW